MKARCQLVIPEAIYRALKEHLFPGDLGEHGAVIAAGFAETTSGYRLMARELFLAEDGSSYTISKAGYNALHPTFIHKCVTRCRDQRLVYLAIHNHGGTRSVGFSHVDFESHERGYPALLDIASGMPVGALVLANEAVQIDLWLPNKQRFCLNHADVVGTNLDRLYSGPNREANKVSNERYNRQALLFGETGQELLKKMKVGIIGLGGIGALVNEYLSRLGVGTLLLADPDTIEPSNFSRVVGASLQDLPRSVRKSSRGALKVDIAARVAKQANPEIHIESYPEDFSREAVAKRFVDCDYLVLAADSMRSRLVFNAIVHQYFVPGVQLGSKVTFDPKDGSIYAAFSVVRRLLPGEGCLLCNQLINPSRLADEWKTDAERKDQQYGIGVANPSVITMNAVAAAHAVNEFLFYAVGLPVRPGRPLYRRFDHITGAAIYDEPRRDKSCAECSLDIQSRYGKGDAVRLPCSE